MNADFETIFCNELTRKLMLFKIFVANNPFTDYWINTTLLKQSKDFTTKVNIKNGSSYQKY